VDRTAQYCDLRNPEIIRHFGGPGEGIGPALEALHTLGVDMTREIVRILAPPPHQPVAKPDRKDIANRTIRAFRQAEEEAGDRLLNILEFPGSILGTVMMGNGAMETLSILGCSPTESAALFEEAARSCLTFAEEIAASGIVPAVLFMDDLAGNDGPFIAPDTLRALYFPRLREIVEVLEAGGTRVLFHSDGDLSSLASDLIGAGVMGLHPVEPVGHWGLTEAAGEAGEFVLIGNASVGRILEGPDEAARERHRCLEFGKQRQAYFLAPTAEIGFETDGENLSALLTPGI
jgi:hypothetical protein